MIRRWNGIAGLNYRIARCQQMNGKQLCKQVLERCTLLNVHIRMKLGKSSISVNDISLTESGSHFSKRPTPKPTVTIQHLSLDLWAKALKI
jgi:hypothetical protein